MKQTIKTLEKHGYKELAQEINDFLQKDRKERNTAAANTIISLLEAIDKLMSEENILKKIAYARQLSIELAEKKEKIITRLLWALKPEIRKKIIQHYIKH